MACQKLWWWHHKRNEGSSSVRQSVWHGVVSVVRVCSVHDESDEDGRDETSINGQMIIKDLLL